MSTCISKKHLSTENKHTNRLLCAALRTSSMTFRQTQATDKYALRWGVRYAKNISRHSF